MPAPIRIQPLTRDHYEPWLPLWQENCLHQISDDITHETWRRICDDGAPVFGLGAWQGKKLAGILHYVLHPTTGAITPACYMQDVFIAEDFRRQGLARALVNELAETGKREGWTRVYWLAEARNVAAQSLYKTLGIKVDFTLHILPTQ
jgi:ribosomal protein S18 acetylase RimI-like enzyme